MSVVWLLIEIIQNGLQGPMMNPYWPISSLFLNE